MELKPKKIIKLRWQCISCGKEAERLKDGYCDECIKFFRKQWLVTYEKDFKTHVLY